MNKKTVVELPVPVGGYVWLVTKKGYVFKNKVIRYTINGDDPHENRIHTAYIGGDGNVLTRYRALSLFGETMFATEQEAVRAAREMLGCA